MGLLIIVIIIGFWLIKKGNKLNYIDINEDIVIDEIRNTNFEEENNAEYKFEVSLETVFRKRSFKKTKFKTKISLLNNKLKYDLSRKYENTSDWFKNGDRKYNSFTEGIQEFYIKDILSIKYKIGFSFALNFDDFMAFIFAIFGIIFPIISQVSFWVMISTGLERKPDYIIPSVIFFCAVLCIRYLTCKCIEIKYKSEDVIHCKSGNIKKIVFPISRTFFSSVPTSTRQQVNSLLEEIKQQNQNVRTKKDRLKWILISYIIIVCIINVFVPVYLRQKYLRDNDLSYNINNDSVYCDVSFDKGKVVDIQNEKNANGNITSKYIYELTNGEKIEIQDYNKEYGKTYNIICIKYYKKNSNQLFKKWYFAKNDSNIANVFVDSTNYVYDYINQKMYKFNPLNYDNIVDFETKVYYKKNENTNTLYNFINYNINTLDITSDFDVEEFKNNNYETIQKIDTYTSEYGMCYILKANYGGNVDYLIYIENKNKTNLNELDAIILNSRIDRTGSFSNDDKAKKSFRIICPEK